MGNDLGVGGVLLEDEVFVDVVAVDEARGAEEDEEGGEGDGEGVLAPELVGGGAGGYGAMVGGRGPLCAERGMGE